MTYTEIVKKLVGPICAVGSSHVDEDRLENCKEMITLVEDLVGELKDAAKDSHRHEASMRGIGLLAKQCLEDIHHETEA